MIRISEGSNMTERQRSTEADPYDDAYFVWEKKDAEDKEAKRYQSTEGKRMAAGILPEPGSEYGPCLQLCEHSDCRLTRSMAESACEICGLEIGYNTRFYKTDKLNVFVHAICREKQLEKR